MGVCTVWSSIDDGMLAHMVGQVQGRPMPTRAAAGIEVFQSIVAAKAVIDDALTEPICSADAGAGVGAGAGGAPVFEKALQSMPWLRTRPSSCFSAQYDGFGVQSGQ